MSKSHLTLVFIALLLLTIGLSVSWTQHDTLAKNKELLHHFYEEVINKHNPEAIEQFLTTDFVDHNPSPDIAPGIEGVKQMFSMYFAAFPDMQVKVEDTIAEGDKVVARVTIRATHKGDFMGIAATGKPIMMTGIEIVHIKDDKIVERWGNFDELGMMQQLGASPSPVPALETVTLAVTGMAWAGCAKAVQSALENIEGVESVEINLATNKAMVFFEKGKATTKQLVSAVDKAKGMAKYSATVAGAQ